MRNLDKLLGIVLINEECENPKVALMVENLLEILPKRRNHTFYKHVHSATSCRGKYFFKKRLEHCESVRYV